MRDLLIATILIFSIGLSIQGYCQSNPKRDAATETTSTPKQSRTKPRVNQSNSGQSVGYPTRQKIQADLIGHSLAEGVENGYRKPDWRWTIKKGEISNFKISKIVENSKNTYVILASMKLSNGYHAYKANVKIKYILTSQKKWKLDYVLSTGMYIIANHEYDNFIASKIIDDGWGGTYCVQFSNRSEVNLAIGGKILTGEGWQKFSIRLPAGGNQTVGGLFSGGSVQDYRIDFIVRTE